MKAAIHSWVKTLKDTWDFGTRGIRARDIQTVLRAAGKTETMQEISRIQDWLKLEEGDAGFRLLTKEEIATVIFFISSALPILLVFPFIFF
jgi:NAD(P)-dependent dehydrogenase (short-subunit alcohol dehydrogenase family)